MDKHNAGRANIAFSDAVDLFFRIYGRVDFYWHIYVGVYLALIGFIVSQQPKVVHLASDLKALVICAYLVFVVFNVVAIIFGTRLLHGATSELQEQISTTNFKSDVFPALVKRMSYSRFPWFTVPTHLLCDGVMIFCIWTYL